MEFAFSPEQQRLRAFVADFAGTVVAGRGKDLESGEFPDWLWEAYRDAGFLRRTAPVAYGGDGAPLFDMVIMLEELAKVNASAAAFLQLGANFPIEFLGRLGSDRVKEKYLPGVVGGTSIITQGLSEPNAGSALTDLETTAVRDGDHYVVNGLKHYITYGFAATSLVTFARFDPQARGSRGIGAIIVDRSTPGYQVVRKQPNLSAPNGCEAVIRLQNCRTPAENVLVMGNGSNAEGFATLMTAYNSQRVGNATICLGVAQNALRLAVDHARRRIQFGRPICEFQIIQHYIADMAIKIEAARWLVYRAAVQSESARFGLPTGDDAAYAKCMANQMVFEVTDRALQIFGGAGYVDNSEIGKLFLFARGESIAGGTIEMQKNLIAAKVLRRKFDQRRPAAE
jgi:alkylation response protein AidB-like acyl-CoA dehydrogenase